MTLEQQIDWLWQKIKKGFKILVTDLVRLAFLGCLSLILGIGAVGVGFFAQNALIGLLFFLISLWLVLRLTGRRHPKIPEGG